MAYIKSEDIVIFPMLNRATNYYDSSRSLSGDNLQKWADASSKIAKYWTGTELFYTTTGDRKTTSDDAWIFFINGLYIAIKKDSNAYGASIESISIKNVNFDSQTGGAVDASDGSFALIQVNANPSTGWQTYNINDLKNPISEIICDKF